jgi:hypothetical protein
LVSLLHTSAKQDKTKYKRWWKPSADCWHFCGDDRVLGHFNALEQTGCSFAHRIKSLSDQADWLSRLDGNQNPVSDANRAKPIHIDIPSLQFTRKEDSGCKGATTLEQALFLL